MSDRNDKSIMHSLGAFVGHVVKGIRTDPAAKNRTTEVHRTEEVQDREGVVLRRTVIEEVEVRDPDVWPPHAS